MVQDTEFERLIQEGLAQELVGWDFRWLSQRTVEAPLPWSYEQIVRAQLPAVQSLLDIGTGGGEVLSSLAPLPPHTFATEAYPPNVITARARLEPMGVAVVDVSGDENTLPFADASFDRIINRHAGYSAPEIYRALRPGGRYITQQVGGQNSFAFNQFFQDQPYFIYADTTLANDTRALQAAGFRILRQEEAFVEWRFQDIGAVVFYLKVIDWQIGDFSVEKYHDKLYQMHRIIQEQGSFLVHQHRFLIEAEK